MEAPQRARRQPPLHAADLQGLARLATDATVGIVDLVERLHHTILRRTLPLGAAPQGPAPGLTGLVYRTVRGSARLAGRGADALLGTAATWLPGRDSPPARDAALAVLNGIWGDHLAASANPLAIPMRLRQHGQAVDLDRDALAARFPAAGGRLLVLVHGLCMNDRQWTREHGHDHGQALARALGSTPLYLHYNSGRHISSNGRDLAGLLEQLVAHWPVPVTELVLVGHSMGGLVSRSACHLAQQQGMVWPRALRAMAFLGTPHHGAPLERGGRLVDRLLGISPYAAPFARLGKARSAGITDLRYGNLQDGDWQHRSRHDQRHDDRLPTPLPSGVDAYLVAATTRPRSGHPARRAIGRAVVRLVGDDGLVPLASALGRHRDPALALVVPESHQFVLENANHWDLLGRPEVAAQLAAWLGGRPAVDERTPGHAGPASPVATAEA